MLCNVTLAAVDLIHGRIAGTRHTGCWSRSQSSWPQGVSRSRSWICIGGVVCFAWPHRCPNTILRQRHLRRRSSNRSIRSFGRRELAHRSLSLHADLMLHARLLYPPRHASLRLRGHFAWFLIVEALYFGILSMIQKLTMSFVPTIRNVDGGAATCCFVWPVVMSRPPQQRAHLMVWFGTIRPGKSARHGAYRIRAAC